jgi:hypothetical protein
MTADSCKVFFAGLDLPLLVTNAKALPPLLSCQLV